MERFVALHTFSTGFLIHTADITCEIIRTGRGQIAYVNGVNKIFSVCIRHGNNGKLRGGRRFVVKTVIIPASTLGHIHFTVGRNNVTAVCGKERERFLVVACGIRGAEMKFTVFVTDCNT